MHLSFKNICFNHLINHAWSQKKKKKKMGENGEIVRFYGILWYFEKGLMGSL